MRFYFVTFFSYIIVEQMYKYYWKETIFLHDNIIVLFTIVIFLQLPGVRCIYKGVLKYFWTDPKIHTKMLPNDKTFFLRNSLPVWKLFFRQSDSLRMYVCVCMKKWEWEESRHNMIREHRSHLIQTNNNLSDSWPGWQRLSINNVFFLVCFFLFKLNF